MLEYPLSIAPMIDWTYTHFRVLMRLIAPRAQLYTEMQTIPAIMHNPKRTLTFQAMEQPIALQLGGSDILGLVQCAKIAEEHGFTEINLNLGCPSDKVQAGRFGACLMTDPQHVAACIYALKKAVLIPVTAKTRIGVDYQDSYAFFSSFVHQLVDAGCDKLIVHARKAWLHGLNPKQNRSIPAINYDYVYKIKQELPFLPVVINGNITERSSIIEHSKYVDGVMLGRLAYMNPYALGAIHQYFHPLVKIRARNEILQDYLLYIQNQAADVLSLHLLIKPLFNLAHGLPGAKYWKEHLAKQLLKKTKPSLALLLDSFPDESEQQSEGIQISAH